MNNLRITSTDATDPFTYAEPTAEELVDDTLAELVRLVERIGRAAALLTAEIEQERAARVDEFARTGLRS